MPIRTYERSAVGAGYTELPHGERLESKAFSSAPIKSQFALPHGERQVVGDAGQGLEVVSIRAPAWGATKLAPVASRADGVSIRAPAWGATSTMQLL